MRGKIDEIEVYMTANPATGLTSLQYQIGREIEGQMVAAAKGKARAEARLRRLRTMKATEERRERLCRMKRKAR